MMELDFAEHARRRMVQRGITEADVSVTVHNPSKVCDPDPQEGSQVYLRTFTNGRTLKVYVEYPVSRDLVIVRTAVWGGTDQ